MAEMRLTEEIREQMLGLVPFSADSTIEHTPDIFKKRKIPPKYTPIFTVRVFTKEEKLNATKVVKDSKEEELRECVRKNTVKWENLYDAGNKNEIPFKEDLSGGADKAIFDSLPAIIVGDLLFFLVRISGLADFEKLGLKS